MMWFNIATFLVFNGAQIPPLSIYMTEEACQRAMIFHAEKQMVRFISCDVKPLPGATLVRRDGQS